MRSRRGPRKARETPPLLSMPALRSSVQRTMGIESSGVTRHARVVGRGGEFEFFVEVENLKWLGLSTR